MSYLVDNIILLNSSYSKDKVKRIFNKILIDAKITDYILISNIVQASSVTFIDNPKTLSFRCGNYTVSFKYKDNRTKLSSDDVKCLIAALIISIENCSIFNDMTDKIAFSENKDYPTFNDLVSDITKEIEQYKRYGTNFCVAKINMENEVLDEKFTYKIKHTIDLVSDIIRASDSVYRDSKNIYILYRNVCMQDGIKLIDKLKGSIQQNSIGIAEWKSSYVITDLFGEIDNFIYISQTKEQSKVKNLKEDLNKILNKALMFNESIFVVESNKLKDIHKPYIALTFDVNNKNYTVLRRFKDEDNIEYVYKFVDEHVADDILEFLKRIH